MASQCSVAGLRGHRRMYAATFTFWRCATLSTGATRLRVSEEGEKLREGSNKSRLSAGVRI